MVKEKFRAWNPSRKIKVRYKDGSGNPNLWEKDGAELLEQIQGIVDTYSAQEIKLTNRQLYYQLVAGEIIPNAVETYKRICTFLTDARYAGLIDWGAIEDRGRTPKRHPQWNNLSDLIESAVSSYRLPRWSDQEYYLELYCEKQAMESVLEPVANKYHIYFGCNKGYSSASTMYELAQRIKERIKAGKKTVILYLGDHDPSGLDMVRDIQKRILEFLIFGEKIIENDFGEIEESETDAVDPIGDEEGKKNFVVIPIALNMAQIKKYNLPPNPAKITDPRATWYFSQYGKQSWELDALKPEVLMKLTEAGIQNFIDVKKYNAWIEKEKKQTQALETFGKKYVAKVEK